MSEKYNPQIVIIPDSDRDSSSAELIQKVIYETLRTVCHKEAQGRLYFGVDFPEEPSDLTLIQPDVLVLDKTADAESARERIALANRIKPFGRVFYDLEDPYIQRKYIDRKVRIYTYSVDDPDANFYAQKIRKNPEGKGFTFEFVFQSDPKGNGGWKALFVPAMNQSIIFKGSVTSDKRSDIIHAVKAFAVGTSLSVESSYISKAVAGYEFSSACARSEE